MELKNISILIYDELRTVACMVAYLYSRHNKFVSYCDLLPSIFSVYQIPR